MDLLFHIYPCIWHSGILSYLIPFHENLHTKELQDTSVQTMGHCSKNRPMSSSRTVLFVILLNRHETSSLKCRLHPWLDSILIPRSLVLSACAIIVSPTRILWLGSELLFLSLYTMKIVFDWMAIRPLDAINSRMFLASDSKFCFLPSFSFIVISRVIIEELWWFEPEYCIVKFIKKLVGSE